VLEKLREKLKQRREAKRRAAFQDAAAERDLRVAIDDRRMRDLPDPLGDYNESVRLGPSIGGSSGP